MFLDFRTTVSLILLLASDVSGFCSHLCAFFFAAVTVCLTNFGLLALVPSNTQNNSFIIMSAVSVYYFHDCFLFLLQVDRTISPIDSQGHCIFFTSLQPTTLFLILGYLNASFLHLSCVSCFLVS